jgi:hypothetical protein
MMFFGRSDCVTREGRQHLPVDPQIQLQGPAEIELGDASTIYSSILISLKCIHQINRRESHPRDINWYGAC